MTELSSNDSMETNAQNQGSAFQWNAGAWFGGFHLGCTAWMLTACGVSLFSHDLTSALVCLIGFSVANAVGLSLWRNRNRLTAFMGAQLFLVVLAVIYPPIMIMLNWRGLASARETCISVAVVPAVMLWLFIIGRSSRGTKRSQI